jgi:hypothetical protein
MWVGRELALDERRRDKVDRKSMPLGGASGRLGYAMPLRTASLARRHQLKKRFGHRGPYMPVLVHACQEEEFAYEYEHGCVSYGAFTYALIKNWRRLHRAGKTISMAGLVTATAAELRALDYHQQPAIIGPKARLSEAL